MPYFKSAIYSFRLFLSSYVFPDRNTELWNSEVMQVFDSFGNVETK